MICYYNNETDKTPLDGSLLATVFQIWEKRDYVRQPIKIEDRGYLAKLKDPKMADVAITVFGHSCGRVETDFVREPNSTKIYFKMKSKDVLDALESIDFSRFYNNVSYIQALSFPEINFLLNEFFDRKT